MNNKKILHKALAIFFGLLFLFVVPTLAGPAPTLIPADKTPWNIFSEIIIPTLQIVGVAMIIFGAIEMGFAFRSDEAEPKRKGFMVAMSGALLWIICEGMKLLAASDLKNPTDKTGIIKDKIKNDEMAELINALGLWLPIFGFIAMFWGIFELAKAIKSDDAGGKQKALTIIVAGVALWCIMPAMTWILWGA